jgi:hypothetical protein
LHYKAGYKLVAGAVHAQVLDFPAAISCGADLDDARRMLGLALVEVAETLVGLGQALPRPDPDVSSPERDLEEPIFLHLVASSEVSQKPAGVMVP